MHETIWRLWPERQRSMRCRFFGVTAKYFALKDTYLNSPIGVSEW
jgi:hypothetical protein